MSRCLSHLLGNRWESKRGARLCAPEFVSPTFLRRDPTPDTLDGSDVTTTQFVSDSGSAHASIPVDPLCPKERSEHPFSSPSGPSAKPMPRRAPRHSVWLRSIGRAVSSRSALPARCMKLWRNVATSSALQCAPPHGAPSALRVMPSALKICAARKSASGAWRDRSALFSSSWSGRPGRASARGRFMPAF